MSPVAGPNVPKEEQLRNETEDTDMTANKHPTMYSVFHPQSKETVI